MSTIKRVFKGVWTGVCFSKRVFKGVCVKENRYFLSNLGVKKENFIYDKDCISCMFWFSGKKRMQNLENDTKKSFESVKNDVDNIGKWIKHLDSKDKQLFEMKKQLSEDLSTLKEDILDLKETFEQLQAGMQFKQVSKKQTAVGKQTAVCGVQEPVQTGVQTANLYGILDGLTGNEKLVVWTLLNSADEMKLSYEDIARLLGKERSTIRGQINSIKQKSEGLLRETTEPNGKKRVFIEEEIKEKLSKYAKVRVRQGKKSRKKK